MTANAERGRAGAGAIGVNGETSEADRSARGVSAATGAARSDRIRWGAVWTGALTALSIFIALQLLFFALGWLDLGFEGGEGATARAVVSGVLALVAFFLGGVAAGASARWRHATDGLVNGVVAWAVTVVAVLTLALVGGGALLGTLAEVATQFVDLGNVQPGVDVAEATRTARQTAGWAALGLGLTAVVSGLGGTVGAKLWPGHEHGEPVRR